MPKVNLIMPKMGESVSEATVITWLKDIGDIVELDETIPRFRQLMKENLLRNYMK